MRFTLDTNILVYAVDRDAGDRHRIALDVTRRAIERDCILTLQSLAELFRALTGPKFRVPTAEAADIVRRWQDTLPVVVADETCLSDAMDAVTHHAWSFWDAMIWATAKRHGCRMLISEDGQGGRSLGGVTIVNPFDAGAASILEAVLGP
jgi:predicted nucleic acid-binding protein